MESNRYKFQTSNAMRDVLENRGPKSKASTKTLTSFATQNGFFRRNVIDYPNSVEREQLKVVKEEEDNKRSVQKPVALAGFTKADFQRLKDTLFVLHSNKVPFCYLKLMLNDVQDWLNKFGAKFIYEDQLLEIMNKTIKLGEEDADKFIQSLCDLSEDAKKFKGRIVQWSYLKRFVDYYCYAPNTTRPWKNETSKEVIQAFSIVDVTDIRDSLHQARKDLLS